jgi:hypothetical protein
MITCKGRAGSATPPPHPRPQLAGHLITVSPPSPPLFVFYSLATFVAAIFAERKGRWGEGGEGGRGGGGEAGGGGGGAGRSSTQVSIYLVLAPAARPSPNPSCLGGPEPSLPSKTPLPVFTSGGEKPEIPPSPTTKHGRQI